MVEYIGIDLGGTNIRVGAINEQEEIIFIHKESTYENVTTAEDLYEKIVKLIKMVPNYESAKAIGIGLPGAIDVNKKCLVSANNLSIFVGFPIVEKLKNEFNKSVFIENDARVAALGEAIKGAGKGKNIVCYITISTGLGGGVVINEHIYTGSNNYGAYFSSVVLDGKNTCDSLISGTALIKKYNENLVNTIKTVDELFSLNNEKSIEIINEFKTNLVNFLLMVSSFINPDVIILGGGVVNSKQYFLEDVKCEFEKRAHPLVKQTIIDTIKLEEPGLVGACLIAKL